MVKYSGIIIEESLQDTSVLKLIKIISTKVEPITPEHKTPSLKQWTLHSVEIPEESAISISEKLSHVLDSDDTGKSGWYADFKNETAHIIIFRDKVFYVNRSNPKEYEAVVTYGVSRGIPYYQLDFSPQIKEWERSQA